MRSECRQVHPRTSALFGAEHDRRVNGTGSKLMKKILIAFAAASLLVASAPAAFARGGHGGGHGGGFGGGFGGGHGGGWSHHGGGYGGGWAHRGHRRYGGGYGWGYGFAPVYDECDLVRTRFGWRKVCG
jgi:hypothetical protein